MYIVRCIQRLFYGLSLLQTFRITEYGITLCQLPYERLWWASLLMSFVPVVLIAFERRRTESSKWHEKFENFKFQTQRVRVLNSPNVENLYWRIQFGFSNRTAKSRNTCAPVQSVNFDFCRKRPTTSRESDCVVIQHRLTTKLDNIVRHSHPTWPEKVIQHSHSISSDYIARLRPDES